LLYQMLLFSLRISLYSPGQNAAVLYWSPTQGINVFCSSLLAIMLPITWPPTSIVQHFAMH
jgi:hypothetical protein